MDRIIALSETSPQAEKIDEAKFLSFMKECPIWDYFKISQTVYLKLSNVDKSKMISGYYKNMSDGKIFDRFCLDLASDSGEFFEIKGLFETFV